LVRIVTFTLRSRNSPKVRTPNVPGMKYGDEMTTSCFDAITRSMTLIVTLMDRAISSDVAVTLAGGSANACAFPQFKPRRPASRSSLIGP
jgi:hypothetical protein